VSKIPCKKCGVPIHINRFELCKSCKTVKCAACGANYTMLAGQNSNKCYKCRESARNHAKWNVGGVDGV
jgi:hypothetical protein